MTFLAGVLARVATLLYRRFGRRCVCGHDFDSHKDITSRCCFRVTVGLDYDGLPYPDPDEAPNPISRICDLCPPSGFTTTGEEVWIYNRGWPREHWLTGETARELWAPVDARKDAP